jgi:hypothetical protein
VNSRYAQSGSRDRGRFAGPSVGSRASNRLTDVVRHRPALRAVGILRSLRAAAIPCSVVTPPARSSASIGARSAARSRARAAITLGPLARALAVNGLWFLRTPPSETPRAFALASAAFVRSEIAFASCSATAAIMWIVSRFACAKSTASNSTPASISADTKATLWASRSSLAMISVAPWTRHSFKAAASLGRSARLPVSIWDSQACTFGWSDLSWYGLSATAPYANLAAMGAAGWSLTGRTNELGLRARLQDGRNDNRPQLFVDTKWKAIM